MKETILYVRNYGYQFNFYIKTKTKTKKQGIREIMKDKNSNRGNRSTVSYQLYKYCHIYSHKKRLKIPKGYSESINRRSTGNTMTKRKRTKGQTTTYKTLHIKLKIE